MKFSISLVALFATGILASPASPPPKTAQKCPADRVWNDCGSACPETCTSSPDRVCIAVCVRGCFCKKGDVLNDVSDSAALNDDC
ncbi:hypothetical protein ACHAPT_010289 [Fusarium lateritium]